MLTESVGVISRASRLPKKGLSTERNICLLSRWMLADTPVFLLDGRPCGENELYLRGASLMCEADV